GEHSAAVAKVDMNLAQVAIARGDFATAVRTLEGALAIYEAQIGADALDTGDVVYNLVAALRAAGDIARARPLAARAVAIFGAKAPGSIRHRTALDMAAELANTAKDPAAAEKLARASLALAKPDDDPQIVAWTELELGRALVGLHRASEARPLIADARKK